MIIRNSVMELKTIFRWQTWTEFSHNRQIKQTLCKTRVQKVVECQSFSTFTVSGKRVCPLIQGFGEGGHRGQRLTGSVSSGFVLVVHVQRHLNIRQLHLTHHAAWRSRGPAKKLATCERKDAKKRLKFVAEIRITLQKCVLNQWAFYSASYTVIREYEKAKKK